MSSNCTFDLHISIVYKQCSNLAGWILRTFTIRDTQLMLTLYKSLVVSRLEYASQLWSPYLLKHVYLIEKVQRAFTKHIPGMCFISYSCCIFGFPKHTHYVCWWRLAISAGGLSSACQFQSYPRKLTRGKLLMKHMHTILPTWGDDALRHLGEQC